MKRTGWWIAGILIAVLVVGATLHRARSQPREDEKPHVADPASQRRTLYGDVVGYVEGGAHAWLGIPYADPPVRDRRWRAPHPPRSWAGTRESLAYGPPCLQWGGPTTHAKEGTIVGSEDCLTLNVFAPRADAPAKGAERLPVMVWIHGGGNSAGSSSQFTMAARLAARHKLVLVTINYRLGIFGWFHYTPLQRAGDPPEERSGNYGTLDQIEALRWVQNNVSGFGGDPDRVTVFGESAGGTDVFALLASPLAKDLFQRAIVQSGTTELSTPEQAENFVTDAVPGEPGSSNELLLHLAKPGGDRTAARRALGHIDPDARRELLATSSGEELLQAFAGHTLLGMYRSPKPIADGAVLPAAPLEQVFRDPSRFNAVPTIVGGNRDEYRLFAAFDPEYVRRWFGLPMVRDAARYERLTRHLSQAWRAEGVSEPAAALQAALGDRIFVYRFDWSEEPAWPVNLRLLLGAAHALEIPFVFGAPEIGIARDATRRNLPGRTEVSDAMSSYWAQFAYAGSPGRGRDGRFPEWTAWRPDAEAPRTLAFDTQAGGGVRMIAEVSTYEEVGRAIGADPALKDDAEERCRLYARAFRWFRRDIPFDAQRYASLGCGAYPVEGFKPKGLP